MLQNYYDFQIYDTSTCKKYSPKMVPTYTKNDAPHGLQNLKPFKMQL